MESMKKRELKEKMEEKNVITINGEEWFLDNPFDIGGYPCYLVGSNKLLNYEKLEGSYEIILWILEGEGQEVEGKIHYFQVPVLKQV